MGTRIRWLTACVGLLACTGRTPPTDVQDPPIVEATRADDARSPDVGSAPPAPLPVTLRVLDPWEQPVAGARVLLDDPEGDDDRPLHTDPQGRVELPRPGAIAIEADGFVRQATHAPEAPEPRSIYLLPASTLSGRIVDARTEDPVAGVRVEARGSSRPPVTTGSNGRFEFDGLPPGRVQLLARGPGLAGGLLTGVGLAHAVSVELPVHPTAAIEARVFESDGRPCTGGDVTLIIGAEGPSGGCPICGGADPEVSAGIDSDGRVRFEVPRDLLYGVRVYCEGYVGERMKPVHVRRRDVSGLRWTIDRGWVVRGRTVDADGRPVPDIQVVLSSESIDDRVVVASDAEGRFRFRGLVSGTYDLDAFTEEPIDWYSEGSAEVVVDGADLDDVVMTLSREQWSEEPDDEQESSASLEPKLPPDYARGSVVDEHGEPVAGALVAVSYEVSRERGLRLLHRRWNQHPPVRTDERGGFAAPFRFEDDTAQDLTIVAYARGGAVGLVEVEAPTTRVELRVQPLGSITGEVQDRRGRPARYFGVDLSPGRPRLEFVHAPRGRFTVEGLIPGVYPVLIATPRGDARASVMVQPGRSTPVEPLRLRPPPRDEFAG